MVILYIIFGIIGGLLGGMGMGGGTLLIPLLTIGLSVPQQTAQFINLVAFIPMSALALIVHIRNGYVVKKRIFYVIVPALVFAVAGSFIATVVSAAILKKAFGGFLILLGAAYFFYSIFTRKSAK
ncbi:MAG: sulfite exporter TauE/SafE family protein [Eubacteriales bacterium]|nr:sulfite exporter TauE/SafE family protein [Christensenellaceae bacterium]MDY3241160.1 sulfite exporter TauE/SafE family protein [Eubacteriales bacterium]MCI7584173.1 sulfite exporter TauE/SafE family protein [Christensenellaceae bacterium]MCI7769075.1 sulfite exporter TauE/SafE family protein [Christensenellaceae bacterium]MDD6360540.1 sulfite exporter TauE/SafE family protein [Christensenellaceae bacterium]